MYNVLIVVSRTYCYRAEGRPPSRKELNNYVYREFYP